MRLVRIAKVFWEVTAILSGRGESVWTWLEQEGADHHVGRMKKRLKDLAPRNHPPNNRHQGTQLRDGINEFKTGPEKGPKLRVLYFYDEGRRIVCTHGFWKRDTNSAEIKEAIRLKREYFRKKKQNGLTVVDLEDLERERDGS